MTFAKHLSVAVIMMAAAAQPACANAADKTINLALTLRDEAGQPIANAPFEAASDVQSQFAMTDANGEASFTIVAGDDDDKLTVRMTDGGFTPLVPADLRREATDRFHALRQSLSFKPYYFAPIQGNVAAVTVVPQNAVTITGRLVDSSGNPRDGVIGVRGRVSFDFVYEFEAGVFTLGGVPKGLSVELWYGSNTQIHVIALTAEQTAQDTDVGDVTLADTSTDGGAAIVMQNTSTLRQPSMVRMDRSLSLIAVDDAEPHIFEVKSDGRAYWTDDNSNPVYTLQLPAGTYYVTPGSYGDRPFFALYESVKAGRQAQLDAAGVPTITIVVGQTAEFTFDAQAAHDAIIEVGGDLVDE